MEIGFLWLIVLMTIAVFLGTWIYNWVAVSTTKD